MKKPILIRLEPTLYEKLLIYSAELTVERKRSVTVPALIVELVGHVMANRSERQPEEAMRQLAD